MPGTEANPHSLGVHRHWDQWKEEQAWGRYVGGGVRPAGMEWALGGPGEHSSRWPQWLAGKCREESPLILAPGWFQAAPLFVGSGRADIEVSFILREERLRSQAPSWEGGEATLPHSPEEEAR